MKTALLILACGILFFACKNEEKKQPEKTLQQAKDTVMPKEIYTDLYGTYSGDFADARSYDEVSEDDPYAAPVKISINISQITETGANGRSVVRGNDRPMTGKLTKAGDKYTFVMDEPGNDKHDGRFNFYIQGDSLIGEWIAYDTKMKAAKKTFALVKKQFQYNANLMLNNDWELVDWEGGKVKSELYTNEDGTVDTLVNEFYRSASDKVYKINASKQKLTEAQLKNLRKLDLEIIRNTIFARHGYAFKSKRIRQFFDPVEWYIPVASDVEAGLTPLEKDNIALLKRFEKYAEDNYDTFGR